MNHLEKLFGGSAVLKWNGISSSFSQMMINIFTEVGESRWEYIFFFSVSSLKKIGGKVIPSVYLFSSSFNIIEESGANISAFELRVVFTRRVRPIDLRVPH